MILGNNSYEEQTRKLLAEAKSELNKVIEKKSELNDKATILEQEVNAYETALQAYLKRMGKQAIEEIDWKKILKKGNSHRERIRLIAEQKGGKIRISQVTNILFSNGFINAKKHSTAYSVVQISLADMKKRGEVEKIGLGEYRLTSTQ